MHVVLEYHAGQGAYRATAGRFDGWGATKRRAITALAERLQTEAAHGGYLAGLGHAAEYWPPHELAAWLTASTTPPPLQDAA
jgi:hypothetical protein